MKLKFKKKQNAVVRQTSMLVETRDHDEVLSNKKDIPLKKRSDLYLINAKNVKQAALAYSSSHRAGYFTRVSKDFLLRCQRNLANFIDSEVQRHPSNGKTIQ